MLVPILTPHYSRANRCQTKYPPMRDLESGCQNPHQPTQAWPSLAEKPPSSMRQSLRTILTSNGNLPSSPHLPTCYKC
ncbi:hypothetical protein TNCV_1480651 [Trichonephila clavipes]|nr:hypothetical protein TNCV_1480651 [Trichonephila clavipes]